MRYYRTAPEWERLPRPEIGFYREDTGEGYRAVYNPSGRGVVICHRGDWEGRGNEYLPRAFGTLDAARRALRVLMIEKGILK